MHHVIELTLIKLRGYKYQNKIQFVISTETTKIIMILTSLLSFSVYYLWHSKNFDSFYIRNLNYLAYDFRQ